MKQLGLICFVILIWCHYSRAAEAPIQHAILVENDHTFNVIEQLVSVVGKNPGAKDLLHARVVVPLMSCTQDSMEVHTVEQAPTLLEWLCRKPRIKMEYHEAKKRAELIDALLSLGVDPDRYAINWPLAELINFPDAQLRSVLLAHMLSKKAAISTANGFVNIGSIILGRLKNCEFISQQNPDMLPATTARFEITHWMEDLPMFVERGVSPFLPDKDDLYHFMKNRNIPFILQAIKDARKQWKNAVTRLLLCARTVEGTLFESIPFEIFEKIYWMIFDDAHYLNDSAHQNA